MMHLKIDRGTTTVDLAKYSEFVSAKENRILSLTKLVVAISILLATLMVVSH
ncbi:MAG: hypothetical protein OQK63_07230 [Ignavibacteriaceae bacterium]|jgi:hypothetical protein|nr:hypothetical protein [Chlorobium sp.]MCW8823862.1 hypothetical protein [Ignavibacteriaceae bacterium]MCW9095507.1 hypothetical protein [Ignavibacteriaceae bacterium]